MISKEDETFQRVHSCFIIMCSLTTSAIYYLVYHPINCTTLNVYLASVSLGMLIIWHGERTVQDTTRQRYTWATLV